MLDLMALKRSDKRVCGKSGNSAKRVSLCVCALLCYRSAEPVDREFWFKRESVANVKLVSHLFIQYIVWHNK